MTEYQISKLLDELQSKEVYNRNDAIKKIIKGKINDERIIDALNNMIENDAYPVVRNFARSALDVFGIEHSEVELEAQVHKTSDETGIKFQPKLETDRKKIESRNDFWLGVGLFLVMNFILWQFGSDILKPDFMFPGESAMFGTRGSAWFRHFVSLLCGLTLINGGVFIYFNKRRPQIALGMLAPVGAGIILYIVITLGGILLYGSSIGR